MPNIVSNSAFLVRFDWRWCAKQVLDGATAGTSATPPTLSDLQDPLGSGGSVLAALIADAEDLVMGAAAIGNRYSYQDIHDYGGNLLVRIVTGLAMGLVLQRRGRATEDLEALSQPYAEAMEYLEKLRQGERVFWQVPGVPEAGVPESAPMRPRPGIDPPLITTCASRYFGSGRPTASGGCSGNGCGGG